jgi:protein-S-isoprenylcysteine O-methyltransferase Ste14
MIDWIAAIVALGYASLLLELTVLHVPSVASTRRIWSRSPTVVEGYSPAWRGVFDFSAARKVVLFVLPVVVIWGVLLYPAVALLVGDALGDHLFAAVPGTSLLAALLIVVGRAITLSSVLTLRRAGRALNGDRLTTRGLFRFSRNPGLVGMYLFVGGLWLTSPSLTMLCGTAVYVLYMDVKVRMEEDYLSTTAGEAYRHYRQRTPRYLP